MQLTSAQQRALRLHLPPIGWPEGPLRATGIPYGVAAAMERKGLCFVSLGVTGWCSTLTPAGRDARDQLVDMGQGAV